MTGSLLPRERRELAPGAVHLPDWLTLDEQRELVASCRAWARPTAPMRATRLPNGGVMSVRTVCLGWHWEPYRYTRWATAPADEGGARERVKSFPTELAILARRAVADAYGDAALAAAYEPDCALVNHYDATAKMGLHLDKEEVSPAPVVSLSLGDACRFRFGNTETRGKPYVDVELRSGDLVVFGGPSRFAYHGVPRTFPGTGEPSIGLAEGRLNLTIRETGLTDAVVDAEEAARAARAPRAPRADRVDGADRAARGASRSRRQRDPDAEAMRSPGRSGPGADALRSPDQRDPGSEALRSPRQRDPGAEALRSPGRSGPGAEAPGEQA